MRIEDETNGLGAQYWWSRLHLDSISNLDLSSSAMHFSLELICAGFALSRSIECGAP